jgi:hypothetical protein
MNRNLIQFMSLVVIRNIDEDAHTIIINQMNYLFKYLFKYVTKGPDHATVRLEQTNCLDINEIKKYMDMRYVGSSEAFSWQWNTYDCEIN